MEEVPEVEVVGREVAVVAAVEEVAAVLTAGQRTTSTRRSRSPIDVAQRISFEVSRGCSSMYVSSMRADDIVEAMSCISTMSIDQQHHHQDPIDRLH